MRIDLQFTLIKQKFHEVTNLFLVALTHHQSRHTKMTMSCCVKKIGNITATILCRVIAIHMPMQDLHKFSDWHLEGAGERTDKPFELLSLPKILVQ